LQNLSPSPSPSRRGEFVIFIKYEYYPLSLGGRVREGDNYLF
jgi:hypothetical protein